MSFARLSLVGLALIFSGTVALAQGTPQQRAACRPDVVKFCKGKGEDPGIILTCLEENKDKLAEKCRKVIAEADPQPAEKKADAPAAKQDEKPAEAKPAEKK